jgi:protein-disulfide isomerase
MAGNGRKTNWFAIWVSAAVVVVLVVVGIIVVVVNNQATAPGEAPKASNIDADTGAIHVGEGSATVATYIDFMCPICNQFEQSYGETLQGLVDDGSITLDIHPIAILDAQSQGTEYSTRAANAMYCVAVADADASVPFMQAMYANQPEEGTPGLTDEEILAIAATAGVSDIDDCVAEGTYTDFVATMTPLTPPDENGRIGTPTVVVNDERITLTGDPQVDIVDRVQG